MVNLPLLTPQLHAKTALQVVLNVYGKTSQTKKALNALSVTLTLNSQKDTVCLILLSKNVLLHKYRPLMELLLDVLIVLPIVASAIKMLVYTVMITIF